jgi:hypothetical protein
MRAIAIDFVRGRGGTEQLQQTVVAVRYSMGVDRLDVEPAP